VTCSLTSFSFLVQEEDPMTAISIPWGLGIAVALSLAAAGGARAGVIIFDNSSGSGGGITTTSSPQLGGEVTDTSGTPRTVTELDLGFTSQGLAATVNLQAFLYANDGSGGSPGTLLWQSVVMSGVNIDSANSLIAFDVPSVVVPGTFTFAAAITNSSPIVGEVPANGATTGTFVQGWDGRPGSWQALPVQFEVEARVIGPAQLAPTPVPEPSSLALLSLGGLALAGCRRWKRRPTA
jgi:PEP-CTERM motif